MGLVENTAKSLPSELTERKPLIKIYRRGNGQADLLECTWANISVRIFARSHNVQEKYV